MSRFFYDKEVTAIAGEYGLDPLLVKAVVLAESGGKTSAYRYEPGFFMRYLANKPEFKDANPERVSASYGLMQVMYTTGQQHGLIGAPEALFVPVVGLSYGCAHLASLLKKCDGNVEQALAQYNGGETGNEHAPYRNAGYVRTVMLILETLKDTA